MEKWDLRGFTIALPGLVKERVSRHVRDGNYYELTCGLLLKADRPNVVAMQTSGPREEVRKKDTMVQRCTVLTGVERIAARKFGKVSLIDSRNENCTPIHVTRNGLLLV